MHGCQSLYWGWTIEEAKKVVLRAHVVSVMAFMVLGCFSLVTILAGENGLQWKRLFQSTSFCLLSTVAKAILNVTLLSGDCNTGQWETQLQTRNKEVCFAYQLLTTSRVAFGCCCLWFCRCMPSCGSRVMDPFPRKLHWNILTATFP